MSPKTRIKNTEELETIITLELEDKHYRLISCMLKESHMKIMNFKCSYRIKKAFVKDFIYAAICHDDDEVDPLIQRKKIIDNLLQNLNMLSTHAANGYWLSSSSHSCYTNKFIQLDSSILNDTLLFINYFNPIDIKFPIEIVEVYTNSEQLPQTKLTAPTIALSNVKY